MHRLFVISPSTCAAACPPFFFFTHNTLCLGTVQYNEIKIEFPLSYRLDKSPFCGGKGGETGAGAWRALGRFTSSAVTKVISPLFSSEDTEL